MFLVVVTVKMYHQFYPRVRVEVRFQQRLRLRGEVGGGEGRNPLGVANHLSWDDQGQHQHQLKNVRRACECGQGLLFKKESKKEWVYVMYN